jgi:hypothetical protein
MNKQAINNMAVFTGVKTAALRQFIKKYQLDVPKLERNVMKYKNVRKDLAAAISGYENNELVGKIVSDYGLEENRRADDFFTSKHGNAILKLLKRNGNTFSNDLVKHYLYGLNTDDYKWARIMDFIGTDLGLNIAMYSTFEEQEKDMLDAIEKLYNQYPSTDEKIVVSKKTVNEMVEKATQDDREIEQERQAMKRIVINVAQFEALLNHLLNPINKSIAINEGVLEDTYTFEVYSGRMKKFLDFIQDLPTISTIKIKKDGHYVFLTLRNSGNFEAWQDLVKFYKEQIKI